MLTDVNDFYIYNYEIDDHHDDHHDDYENNNKHDNNK